MTCKLAEDITKLYDEELNKLSADRANAEHLLKMLETDCGCMTFKTSKINRSWKNLWFGSYEVIDVAPKFKIYNKLNTVILCTFGDVEIHVRGDSSKVNDYIFSTDFVHGKTNFINYEELLKDLTKRLYMYSKIFMPGYHKEWRGAL